MLCAVTTDLYLDCFLQVFVTAIICSFTLLRSIGFTSKFCKALVDNVLHNGFGQV